MVNHVTCWNLNRNVLKTNCIKNTLTLNSGKATSNKKITVCINGPVLWRIFFSNNGTNADSAILSTTVIICFFNYLLTLIRIEQQDLACNVRYRDTVSCSLWAAHNINTLCAFDGDINENNFFNNVRYLVSILRKSFKSFAECNGNDDFFFCMYYF